MKYEELLDRAENLRVKYGIMEGTNDKVESITTCLFVGSMIILLLGALTGNPSIITILLNIFFACFVSVLASLGFSISTLEKEIGLTDAVIKFWRSYNLSTNIGDDVRLKKDLDKIEKGKLRTWWENNRLFRRGK